MVLEEAETVPIDLASGLEGPDTQNASKLEEITATLSSPLPSSPPATASVGCGIEDDVIPVAAAAAAQEVWRDDDEAFDWKVFLAKGLIVEGALVEGE